MKKEIICKTIIFILFWWVIIFVVVVKGVLGCTKPGENKNDKNKHR